MDDVSIPFPSYAIKNRSGKGGIVEDVEGGFAVVIFTALTLAEQYCEKHELEKSFYEFMTRTELLDFLETLPAQVVFLEIDSKSLLPVAGLRFKIDIESPQ